MRKPKIKPCPFCRQANAFVERDDICVYRVWCDCGARGPACERGEYADREDGDDLGERDAIRRWNARTPAAAERERVRVET
jgi:hypothetical protein